MTSVASARAAGAAASRRRLVLAFAGTTLLLAAVAVLGVTIGSRLIPVDVALDAVLRFDGSDVALDVRASRIPRTVLGLLVGAALGAAGAVMQGLTRNALADPGLFGVNAGASLAVAIAVAAFGITAVAPLVAVGLVGAFVATALVVALGSAGRGNPITLVLAGVALAAVLGGATTAIVLLHPSAFMRMRSWESGTLAGRDLELAIGAAPLILVGLFVAIAVSRSLDALALGDDAAVALGVPVGALRAAAVVAVTLLAGGATAVAGPIAFLGLAAPHLARGLVGPSHTRIVPASILVGAAIVVVADVIGRLVIAPQEVPVGIVMAFVAAPWMIWLGRRRTLVQA